MLLMASSRKLRYDRGAAAGKTPRGCLKYRVGGALGMSMPLKPAVAGERRGRCVARAALLLLIAFFQPAPARADDQPDPYTVTVKVDATSANAVDARRLARLDGERRALAQIVAQLSGSQDVKLPKLSDDAVSDMVDNFEVADEHMSAVRYLADYTFHFHPAQVRRLMQQSGIAFTGSSPPAGNPQPGNASGGNAAPSAVTGGAVVVLPVFEDGAGPVLWDDPNPWRDAWSERPAGSGADRLTVPLGGVSDLSVIDAPQAVAGKSDALGAIAAHNGGGDAIVALATAERQGDRLSGLAVTVKRYRQGQLADTQTETFGVTPGESEADFMRRAVGGTAAAIESGANEVGADNEARASLTATVPISGLGEWVEVRARLEGVPGVRKVDLLSLNRREARIEITYSGTSDQLKSSLAEADLDLGGSDSAWQVRPADAASQH
jgi:hypothetical protein